MRTMHRLGLSAFALATLAGLPTAAYAQDGADVVESGPTLTPGTIAYDRTMWLGLLREHGRIRRTVRHSEEGLEAVTVSDDPMVAAAITDHALAMQRRMRSGSGVRRWDPVFAQLFDNHDAVHIEVTTLSDGVRITETGATPEARAILRAHAIGLNEFVRGGFDVSPNETAPFDADAPLPPDELTIGGIRHRFLLEALSEMQIARLADAGVGGIVECPAREATVRAAAAAGLPHVGLPADDPEKAADILRAAVDGADAEGRVWAFVGGDGTGVGAAWARYRVAADGADASVALAEARALQAFDPIDEARLELDLVRAAAAAGE